MIRMSETVLAGHPDKFCDQVADAIVGAAMSFEPEAYAQVEVAAWCDQVWLNGGIATDAALPLRLEEIVQSVADRIGYGCAYRVHDAVCRMLENPRRWTRKVNDQSIVVGWAGYDELTGYLPPEHYLGHIFRTALEAARVAEVFNLGGAAHEEGASSQSARPKLKTSATSALSVFGPDGKLLLRIREEGTTWHLEHLLVTVQQREDTAFLDVVTSVSDVLHGAWESLRRRDSRWRGDWHDVDLLVNPNGPLVSGGTDGDNGQTGRKLVVDFYGPRVPIGGGALSGKHLTHIDRAGAYAAREAAVRAVKSGARACRVVVAYAPNDPSPLEVIYEMESRGRREPAAFFHHDAIRARYSAVRITDTMPSGDHFVNQAYPWNQ